jgi:hypothetical protein
MRRFITEADSFERVALREDEFENLVPRFWANVAPGWDLFKWKPLLDGPSGRARPDAIVLSSISDRWMVVEVELAHHPESHFRDQFDSLSNAHYGLHLQESLVNAAGGRSREEIKRRLQGEPPGFLCIADEANDKLTATCRDFGFDLAIFTPFRSRQGHYAVDMTRVPRHFVESRGAAKYMLRLIDTSWGGRLVAELPSDFPRKDRISVRYGDEVSDIKVRAISGRRRVFLPEKFRSTSNSPVALRGLDPQVGLFELT